MKRFFILIIVTLLLAGCINQVREVVCPDGSITEKAKGCSDFVPKNINVDPSDFSDTTLSDKENFVLSKGQIRGPIQIFNNSESEISIYPTGSPGMDYDSDLSRMKVARSTENQKIETVQVGPYLFNYTLSAPLIPGEYRLAILDGRTRQYNITVIDEIKNESIAYMIADRFMYYIIKDKREEEVADGKGSLYSIKNWEITSKSATQDGSSWESNLAIKYDICGDDLESNNCIYGNIVEGNFIIDKKTGQIIG